MTRTRTPLAPKPVRAPRPARSRFGPRSSPPRARRRARSRGVEGVLRAQAESAATTSLVLGLLSVVLLGLLGPFAILKANEATAAAIRARIPTPTAATAGLVLGWVATGCLIIAVGYWALILGIFAAAA